MFNTGDSFDLWDMERVQFPFVQQPVVSQVFHSYINILMSLYL